jgi:hypothetical protein
MSLLADALGYARLAEPMMDAAAAAYVALTRGTDANIAYVFTLSPKLADPAPGPRPAPELARYDHIHTERALDPALVAAPVPAGTALGVLAAVLDRDGQQLSATQTRQQALADAGHLVDPEWQAPFRPDNFHQPGNAGRVPSPPVAERFHQRQPSAPFGVWPQVQPHRRLGARVCHGEQKAVAT